MDANTHSLELTVVEATGEHIDSLAELQLSLINYMAQIAPDGFGQTLKEPPSIEEVKTTFVEAIEDANTCLLVAQVGQRTAGFVLGVVEEYTDDLIMAPFLTVQYVGVHPDFRHHGIATRLMGGMDAFAKSRGFSTVELLVWDNNPGARALFTKLGYMPLVHRMAKLI